MMPKHTPQPTQSPEDKDNRHEQRGSRPVSMNEPLSGSKKVKNRNHSRQNHGEG